LHVRDGSGHEYLTYSFGNVTLSNFQLTQAGDTAPVDRITLAFAPTGQSGGPGPSGVTEHYTALNPDGTTNDNHAHYDSPTATVDVGKLSVPALVSPPMVGVTFDSGSGPGNELAVRGFSWRVSGGMSPSVQDFQLTLDPSSVEPGLWSTTFGHGF